MADNASDVSYPESVWVADGVRSSVMLGGGAMLIGYATEKRNKTDHLSALRNPTSWAWLVLDARFEEDVSYVQKRVWVDGRGAQ